MYYYLTGALKRKILRELKMCFRHIFPEHKDILEYINHKYAFKNRPQKGIVVTNASANPRKLSADNFQGTVISHVMQAQVDNHPGVSIEWVKEDVRKIQNNNGVFPSRPGIYYVEVLAKETVESQMSTNDFQNLLDTEGDHNYYFYVDPLITIKQEPVLQIQTGNEDTAFVLNTPVLDGTIRVYADQEQLTTGHLLKLTATESLEVKNIPDPDVDLGLPVGQVPAQAISSNEEPFNVTPGQNDTLDFSLNGTDVSIPLTGGIRTAEEIAADVRNALYGTVPSENFTVGHEDGKLVIEATESIEFSSDTLSTASPLLGYSEGFVPVVLEGRIFPPYITSETTLPLVVNGNEEEISLYQGSKDPEDFATFIENQVTGLTVEAVESGDYTFDPSTGEITLIRPFDVGTKITADYKYPIESVGPFGIEDDYANSTAIPGVVIAFGRRLSDGDKSAIVVHESRVPVASEYGGRWEMSIELDIITRDPQTREELSDLILMYFFAIRKGALSEEGIELTDISFGGESEEIYDDTSQDYYFNSSISLSFQTDWSIHVPKPLVIERVTPVSFADEAEYAGTDGIPPDQLSPQELHQLNLKRIGQLYMKGKTRDFESIK